MEKLKELLKGTIPLEDYPLQDDRFATCGLLMTSICSVVVKKNCNNSLKD